MKGTVKLLPQHVGVNINSCDVYGRSLLSYAAERGDSDMVELLLQQDGVDIGGRDNHGRSPLSYAAQFLYEDLGKLLLQQDDVDINGRDNDGRSTLSYAAHWQGMHEDAVKLLLPRDGFGKDESRIHQDTSSPAVVHRKASHKVARPATTRTPSVIRAAATFETQIASTSTPTPGP